MRRMYDGTGASIPSEKNLVYCSQFVADSLVINDLKAGFYCIKIIDNEGDNVEVALDYFDFKYDSVYGSIAGHYFYNSNMAQILALQGEYSANSKTLTLSIIDTNGNPVQSPTSIHVDIYKVGG